jgi:hypothetical protein
MEGNKAMSDIYLAKSDLTGAIYAVNGKSKTNVTEFVVGLIAKETASLRQRVLDLEAENTKQQQAIAVLMEVVSEYAACEDCGHSIQDHDGGFEGCSFSDPVRNCECQKYEPNFAQSKKAEAEKILGGDDE